MPARSKKVLKGHILLIFHLKIKPIENKNMKSETNQKLIPKTSLPKMWPLSGMFHVQTERGSGPA